ncbi:pancreatic secretory granule membrane major glycoprotein GP2-like [Puntigrus tetrazona]|uniref:pancreatic secretory granule membrane major glycoprotein GP2-like n=1 Tax=Puntigrus tetrazona TaxID=1606681 RepID=UPI001C89C867|nr:pancreatic secretory granule membrane major glycoprotein GP2-like [Puntigrus tetrazona]
MRFLILFCVVLLLVNNGTTRSSTDPCSVYTILDNPWRDVRDEPNSNHDDSAVEWNGWYRLYLNGESAQMSEWCVSNTNCGGDTALYLNGSHPQLEDGVVTLEVLGYHPMGGCDDYRSTPIQVKACPGDYYVYKLVRPDVSVSRPSYCAVAFSSLSSDPCYNYQSLDRPWRATNDSGTLICDEYFSMGGWYRFFYYGMDIRMPESCVDLYSCNGLYSLWLNGPHPQIEDGVVTIEICGTEDSGCCEFVGVPIRVKACAGNYYVYEFAKQPWCTSYCIDVSTISPTASVATSAATTFNMTLADAHSDDDPCNNYSISDDPNRSPNDFFFYHNLINGYDDTRVEWDGWYRLFINGSSAQMPEWCFSYMSCGGYSSLWLGGPHPQPEDGVVTRDVYGSDYERCSYYRSDPIQVKACPGNYYVYKLIRPNRIIPAPAYCAVVLTSPPSFDPCYNFNSLEEPWRANTIPVIGDPMNSRCDYDVNWNGWYRLFYNGQSVKMPESCVSRNMCGTFLPLWLSDPHPQLEDGVVTRQVCGSTWNGCCGYKSHPIRVKACPGGYYVYEFVRPLLCAAYCAAFVINPVLFLGDPCQELNCTENERCEERQGVYGCSCKENHYRSPHDSFDFIETCESSSGFMSLSRCELFEAGFPSDILHLNDPNCRGTVLNGRVEFYFDNNDHICGTNLVANGTHFIYKNIIVAEPNSAGHLISRDSILRLPFSCIYSQTQTLSMNINPLESTVHMNLHDQGMYLVRMIPYQDANFSHPFTGSVNVELKEQIFVEVGVDGVDSSQIALVIDKCWATPVNDLHYPLRWDLITDMCPSPNDEVELLQNGVSTSSRFSFSMFLFISQSTKIYLHCAIHLCLLKDNDCSVHCDSEHPQREVRSLEFHHSTSVSVGPLMLSDSNKGLQVTDQVLVSGAPSLCASLMISLISMILPVIYV